MGGVLSFLDMGGYAGFVWPAFGVVGFGMLGLLTQSLMARRRARTELERLQHLSRRQLEAQ
jgi:heme exporter protein CcmD